MAADTGRLARAGLLLAVAIAAQSVRTGQAITGPVINAILLSAPSFIGTAWAMVIGCLTPGIALVVGLLNPGLAPAVPFIAAGNAALILVFARMHRLIGWPAVLPAAGAKYAIIAGGAVLLGIGPPLSLALGIRQFITALLGGMLAWAAARTLDAYRPKHGRAQSSGDNPWR